MAIKISGTTVIDDSRNIVNASGANVTGVITATSFVGSGTSLTGVATLSKVTAMALVFGG